MSGTTDQYTMMAPHVIEAEEQKKALGDGLRSQLKMLIVSGNTWTDLPHEFLDHRFDKQAFIN